jgi:hypothetical protein
MVDHQRTYLCFLLPLRFDPRAKWVSRLLIQTDRPLPSIDWLFVEKYQLANGNQRLVSLAEIYNRTLGGKRWVSPFGKFAITVPEHGT